MQQQDLQQVVRLFVLRTIQLSSNSLKIISLLGSLNWQYAVPLNRYRPYYLRDDREHRWKSNNLLHQLRLVNYYSLQHPFIFKSVLCANKRCSRVVAQTTAPTLQSLSALSILHPPSVQAVAQNVANNRIIILQKGGYRLVMPLSGKLQTKTKPIPMKWQPPKPNTKPIFILPKNTNISPNLKKIVLKIPIKYQENTKKFGTEIPNTDLVLVFSWYIKFLVTDWHH